MNTLLEAALGLAVVYFLLSVLASGIQEMISRYRGMRGHCLVVGMRSLITDRWVYLRIINHPSIVALFRKAPGLGAAPSYLPPEVVAQVLCDVLISRHRMFGRSKVHSINLKSVKMAVRAARDCNTEIGHALLPVVENAKDMSEIIAAISRWYEQGMNRVGGWYKSHTQKQLFIIGFIMSVLLNVDSIAIVETMVRSPALREAMAVRAALLIQSNDVTRLPHGSLGSKELAGDSTASDSVSKAEGDSQHKDPGTGKDNNQYIQQMAYLRAQMNELSEMGFPIGYACLGYSNNRDCTPPRASALPIKIVGFFLTALAVSVGAPFWFDLLGKVINVRSSGPKPG